MAHSDSDADVGEGIEPYLFELEYSNEELELRRQNLPNIDDQASERAPQHRTEGDWWCICCKCKVMSSEAECVCCGEFMHLEQYLEEVRLQRPNNESDVYHPPPRLCTTHQPRCLGHLFQSPHTQLETTAGPCWSKWRTVY